MTRLSAAGYWLAAWIIVFVVLIALSRTRWGKSIVYYTAWLGVVFILVTHANEINTILTQGNITAGEV